jgi:histidyl-tRNA synthetase
MGKERNYRAVRGVKDILPDQVAAWRRVEESFRETFALYGYGEVRIPIFEETALFARSIGETSDIVEKEMYTFPDRSGNSLSLRPEGTAPVVRAFLENSLDKLQPPVKLFYMGPMFRYERPQKGRMRQFHQIGCEFFGIEGPEADAELLEMVHGGFSRLGLPDLKLRLNSLGDGECRPRYRQALVDWFRPRAEQLCENCRRRLEANPLRVLDCKSASCREARRGCPRIGDFLCAPCEEHFTAVRRYLDEWEVPHEVDAEMVRGLDYYSRTTFELTSGKLGAQDAVAAGGRYDGLVESFGGPSVPGLGFALGMERLVMILPGTEDPEGAKAPVFVAALGAEPGRIGLRYVTELRRRGVAAAMDYEGRSLKSQLRRADRLGARHVLMIGDKELAEGKARLRNMETKEQEEIGLNQAVAHLVLLYGREHSPGAASGGEAR